MKKKSKIILFIFAIILLLVVTLVVAVASALQIEVDYDDPESLADVAEQAECYLIMTHPDTDSPELQAALKELDDIALLDVSDEEKIGLIRARFPEESFWPDELKALLRSAESGDMDAQYRLGCLYLNDGPERASAGRVFIGPSYRDIGNVWLPMAADGDARKAYKRVSVTIADKVNLCITNSTWTAGSTVVFRDLNFTSSNAKLSCLGSTVKILSREHNKGEGWTGGDYASRISSSKVVLGDGGAVVWAGGFSVTVR